MSTTPGKRLPVVVHAVTVGFELFRSSSIQVFEPMSQCRHLTGQFRADQAKHPAKFAIQKGSQVDGTRRDSIPLAQARLRILVLVLAL